MCLFYFVQCLSLTVYFFFSICYFKREPKFSRSTVVGEDGSVVSDYRTSSTAFLDRHQTSVVKCIEERAAMFQGNVPPENLEPLQLVDYAPGNPKSILF